MVPSDEQPTAKQETSECSSGAWLRGTPFQEVTA
jgi:hypothetical protein